MSPPVVGVPVLDDPGWRIPESCRALTASSDSVRLDVPHSDATASPSAEDVESAGRRIVGVARSRWTSTHCFEDAPGGPHRERPQADDAPRQLGGGSHSQECVDHTLLSRWEISIRLATDRR